MTQAAPVGQPAEEERRPRWDSRALLRWSRTSVGRRATWLLVGALVFFVSAGWWSLGSREVTDDATVEGPIHPVAPRIDGIVSKVYIDDHDLVEVGEPEAGAVRGSRIGKRFSEVAAEFSPEHGSEHGAWNQLHQQQGERPVAARLEGQGVDQDHAVYAVGVLFEVDLGDESGQ